MTCFDMTKFVSVIPFPLNHQQETWERAFLHQTSKHFEKDDRAFVNDSPEHDLDAIQSRARRRGIFNCESILSLIEQMVPGHMRSRYERYVAASKDKCSGSSVFVDLSQGGDSGHSVIDVGQMPPLTKSSQIMSLSAVGASGEKGHFMTARELDFSQGWPCHNTVVARKYWPCLQHDPDEWYSTMSQHGQLLLRGNGQHLMTMGAWMNWTFSNLILITDVQRFDPVLMCYHIDDSNPFDTKTIVDDDDDDHVAGAGPIVDDDDDDDDHVDGAVCATENWKSVCNDLFA